MANDGSVITLADSAWVDIIPPETQLTSSVLLPTMLIVIAVLIIIATITYWRLNHKQKVIRKLKKLKQRSLNNNIEGKSCVLDVITCLTSGLKISNLRYQMVAADKRHQWQTFNNKLTKCCYSANPVNQKDVADLIEESMWWIKVS